MCRSHHYIIISLLATAISVLFSIAVQADAINDTRKQLLENQRNIIHLRKEKLLFQEELQQAIQQREAGTQQLSLQAEIIDLRDSLNVADTLITNISILVTRQRLLLTTLERGSPPTALDIALNKALNSNLPELAKTLTNNPAARKEITHLRALLKQQARLGSKMPSDNNSVSYAAEQQLAENEFLRLLSLFSEGSDDDEAEDKIIKITGTANGAAFSEDDTLSYLGHNQYHLETTVYTGEMIFTVDGRPWQLSISPKEDQATYMVIYDITDQGQPRLVMFNKLRLLD